MSRAAFIENVARKGNMNKAEAKRMVDLVLGEIEAGLKKSKKEGRYRIGNFGCPSHLFHLSQKPWNFASPPDTLSGMHKIIEIFADRAASTQKSLPCDSR